MWTRTTHMHINTNKHEFQPDVEPAPKTKAGAAKPIRKRPAAPDSGDKSRNPKKAQKAKKA